MTVPNGTWTPLDHVPEANPGTQPTLYTERTGAKKAASLEAYERMYLADPGDGGASCEVAIGLYPREHSTTTVDCYLSVAYELDPTTGNKVGSPQIHDWTLLHAAIASGATSASAEMDMVNRMLCDRVLASARARQAKAAMENAGLIVASAPFAFPTDVASGDTEDASA